MPIRPPSSVDIATAKPFPSSCSMRSPSTYGVLDHDRVRHRRVEARASPRGRSRGRASPSRMKAETPRAPGVSGSVRAKIRNVPAYSAVEINCFVPEIAPAVAVPRCRGAKRAGVRTRLCLGQRERADQLPARERRDEARAAVRRCRSVRIGSVTALVWTATVTPTPASARESSSSTRMYDDEVGARAAEAPRGCTRP